MARNMPRCGARSPPNEPSGGRDMRPPDARVTSVNPAAPLARFNPAQPGARGMKIAATGLLVAMAAIYFAARSLEPAYPWLGWVKAFAEAGMVGGLADWFAVTALFRHPLG